MAERILLGNLVVDRLSYEVWIEEQRIDVTFVEFEIIFQLARHAGRVVTRRQLEASVWGEESGGHSRKLTVHISRLRRKIAPSSPWGIETVKKRGYSLADRSTGRPAIRRAELTSV